MLEQECRGDLGPRRPRNQPLRPCDVSACGPHASLFQSAAWDAVPDCQGLGVRSPVLPGCSRGVGRCLQCSSCSTDWGWGREEGKRRERLLIPFSPPPPGEDRGLTPVVEIPRAPPRLWPGGCAKSRMDRW